MSATLAQLTAGAESAGGAAEFWVFVVAGAVALGSAIAMVALRHAVHAALMLVVNLFAIAVLYAVMEAQFLAVIQLIVYAGAIMVLFLFVLMLLGVAREQPVTAGGHAVHTAASMGLGAVLFVGLFAAVAVPFIGPASVCGAAGQGDGLACAGLSAVDSNVTEVGLSLFTDFVWPFEVTSALLVIAAIGAVVLGRRVEQPGDLVDRGGQARPALPDAHPPAGEPSRGHAPDADGAGGAVGAAAPAAGDDEEVGR